MHLHTGLAARPARLLKPLSCLAIAFTALLHAGSAGASCTGQRLFMLTPQVNEEARISMLGHVDNGTKTDTGRYLAELVVDAQMVADISASIAAGCRQWIHHASGGTIILMGNANGSYDGKSLLSWIPAATGVSENLLPAWREHWEGSTEGAIGYPHDAALKKKQMRHLAVGDVIRLSGKALATATIVNGNQFDQAQVVFSWNGPAPYIEIQTP